MVLMSKLKSLTQSTQERQLILEKGFIQLRFMNRQLNGVENNKVFYTVELYFDGLIDKYVRIIEGLSEKGEMSIEKALDFFYHSETYKLISEGISDMHCMSDEYLVEELLEEYEKKHEKPKRQAVE